MTHYFQEGDKFIACDDNGKCILFIQDDGTYSLTMTKAENPAALIEQFHIESNQISKQTFEWNLRGLLAGIGDCWPLTNIVLNAQMLD